MGYAYDPDALEHEIANGYGWSNDNVLPEESPTESDLLITTVRGTETDIRLQDIEFELAQDLQPAERVVLEAEKIVLFEQRRLDDLAKMHPRYANALQRWLMSEMERLVASNIPIDDEMLAEAEILDQIIAEVSAESEEAPLIKIAEVMRDLIEAQNNLQAVRPELALAA